MTTPARPPRLALATGLALALLGGARAADAPVSRAWSDARVLPADAKLQSDLDRVTAPLCAAGDPAATWRKQVADTEKYLAGLAKDSPNRATFEGLLRDLRRAGPPKPAAAAKPIPAAQALQNARAWLQKNEPAGMKAFAASPDAKDARRAREAAMAAAILRRPGATLAALLAARDLDPKNAETLVNLGGVLVALGKPAEALALLDEAAKLPMNTGALRWPTKATLQANRGHALLRLGRPAEAEKALRDALALAPDLAEASLTLAATLNCVGKPEEAVRFYRRGLRRTPPAQGEAAKRPGAPVEVIDPETKQGEAPKESAFPVAFAFDVSRGVPATLPNLKLPQTPADAVALHPGYQKLGDELAARSTAIMKRISELQAQGRRRPRGEPLVEARRDALERAVMLVDDQPGVAGPRRRADKLEFEVSMIWTNFWHCEGGCSIDEFMTKASQSGDYKRTLRDLCVPALVTKNNSWRGAMHDLADELGAYVKASYRLTTGLAANHSDPLGHEEASLWAEYRAVGAFSTLVHLAELWSKDVVQFRDSCVAEGAAATNAAAPVASALDLPRVSLCKALFDKHSLSLSVKVVEFSVGCDTMALKAATPGWIGVFGKVEERMDTGEFTVTVGAQEGVEIPNTSVGVKAAQGFYVVIGKEGFIDVGVTAEAKASASAKVGPVKIGDSVKGLSGRWSFVSGTGATP